MPTHRYDSPWVSSGDYNSTQLDLSFGREFGVCVFVVGSCWVVFSTRTSVSNSVQISPKSIHLLFRILCIVCLIHPGALQCRSIIVKGMNPHPRPSPSSKDLGCPSLVKGNPWVPVDYARMWVSMDNHGNCDWIQKSLSQNLMLTLTNLFGKHWGFTNPLDATT